MRRRTTLPSGIGMALQQQGNTLEATKVLDAGEERLSSPRGSRGRSVSEVRMSLELGLGVDGKILRAKPLHLSGN